MASSDSPASARIVRDLKAGAIVFVIALPFCLGIAVASKAPLLSGLVSGIIAGIVVGLLSGSHTSVSGPAAGFTSIVAAQILLLGFKPFLLAVFVAGLIQIGLGLARAGFISAFFPSSVIKGLLAAIGVLLVLKQIPHVLGRDTDPEGEMSFDQIDQQNTFTEIIETLLNPHAGAAIIGLLSIAVLVLWDRYKTLNHSRIPVPLVVVALGVALKMAFDSAEDYLRVDGPHLVAIPVTKSLADFWSQLQSPDFTQWANPAIYAAALTLAVVASLETLLNLEAVDKIDPKQRVTPASQELFAQGVGNVLAGLIGGIPITSMVARGSVNVYAGAQSKLSAIFHGILLLLAVTLLPVYLNMIPLSCLGAILLVTGLKLASPALFKRMWSEGRYQFIPFMVTLLAIVFTDPLKGIVIGLVVSISFILYSNLRRPIRRIHEKHLGGDVLRIELANQVSFLNRAALEIILREVPRGGHVLLDASNTHYIDPDVLDFLRDYKDAIAPAHGVQVSWRGFRDRYKLEDVILYVDYSTRDLQQQLTSAQVLQILREGNERFRTGKRLMRDLGRQLGATAKGQHPLAVVLSCIDSRSPAELIFDLGLGDIFSARVAGNVVSQKILGSMEYSCAVAGAKLILVMGHTSCGAVGAAVSLSCSPKTAAEATGCQHLDSIVRDIKESIDPHVCQNLEQMSAATRAKFVDDVAALNVLRSVRHILQESQTIEKLVREGKLAVVGALYHIDSGEIEFLEGNSPSLLLAARTAY